MKSLDKIPHRAWYFLLCYLAFSSYTFYFLMLNTIRPQLIAMYHLDNGQMDAYYRIFCLGLLAGTVLFGVLVSSINYRTCFAWLWFIQILGLIKLLALSPIIVSTSMLHQLKSGLLLIGIANGGIFAVIHPLIALIFDTPQRSKTYVMNYLHTNWPLFVIVTYIFGVILTYYHLDWYGYIYAAVFFASAYFVVAMLLPLPIQVEAHRIPITVRCRSTLRPGYVLLLFCMLSSCILQFSPISWIIHWVETTLAIPAYYVLIYSNSIQLIGRLFAGIAAKKLSPPGLLCIATGFSMFSLYLLSIATRPTLILIVIGLLSLSVAWYWPTYLAIIADRYPLSGGIGMGIMNCIGYYSIFLVVPEFTQLIEVESIQLAFLNLAWIGILGGVLLVAVFLSFRAQGGYKVLSRYDRSML